MFNPIKEVPSLELCKKLKELGYPQDGGGFYWIWDDKSDEWRVIYSEDGIEGIKSYIENGMEFPVVNPPKEIFKAPTCRELGEWLPLSLDMVIDFSPYSAHHRLIIWKSVDGYWCGYIPVNCKFGDFKAVQVTGKDWRVKKWADTEPNACAKMVIWLKENGYITFKKEET